MNTKLSLEDISTIQKQYSSGLSTQELAKRWGVHPTTIRRYIKCKPRVRVTNSFDAKTQNELRRVLKLNGISDTQKVINDLANNFKIELDKTEFNYIQLKGEHDV